jgi:hypothetical protein
MSSKPADCERPDCQWVKTNRNPDIYFCLRCLKEQKLEEKKEEPPKKESPSPIVILVALTVALFISLIFSSTESQHQPSYRHYDPWSHRY